jgi:hypothetical protein
MINLFEYAAELASGLDSLYRGIRYDKSRLVEFMEVNDWFGITPTIMDKAPYIAADERKRVRERLILWLSAFKQPDSAKLNALLNYFEQDYPLTCEAYRDFVESNGIVNAPGAWKLLDCIFYNFDTEITECTETEIEDFIKILDSEATLGAARLFTDFLRFTKLSKWGYEFYSRECPDVSNEAYPLSDYAVMAYCVWGEEMWIRQRLVENAVKSPQFADLWLYTAFHFLCALRSSDFIRLPAPKLPYEAEQVLSDISGGVFPDRLAVTLTDELLFRLKMSGLRPLKTSKYSNVPELKLFVPESLRKPLGVIIAIVLAHRANAAPGGSFVSGADYRNLHGQFFGADFQAAMGTRHLSVRRCNKSYLQGIDAAADDGTPGKPKGYILAALARSHKGGIGALPEITDVYLKDANFTGYKPEFIAAQMFERGVFSFIAATLLEIYSGKDFTRLPIASQTSLIITTGLVPAQIENLTAAVELSMNRASGIVGELIGNINADKQELGAILQNIASGNAPSRMDECLCLMSAVGERCPNPNRVSCIGCGYEILTKSAMQLLIREYGRLNRQRKTTADSESWRYSAMLNSAVLPAIAEIVACTKSLAPEADITSLLDIAERGLELNAAD